MTAKSFTIGAATALIFFVGGLYVGSNRSPVDEVSPVPTNPAVAGLPDDNNRLQAELAAARAEAARLAEANTRLESRVAQLVDAPPPEPVSIGMSRGEVQQAVLNNLRQIHAARTQYVKEHNASPERVHELVGRTAYIKRIPNVAGENYANVPMAADQPMTVKTPDGLIITYDPAGEKTTPVEFTPEELKQREVEEQQRRISASAMKAMEAYRAAHAGERPPNEQALIPFFASPKEGADFVEMLEAQKALKR